jgi:hypothetical protein
MITPEHMITLTEASGVFPGGLGKASILRRIRKGILGVRLRAVFDGGRYWTKEEWIKEFLDEVTAKRLERKNLKIVPTHLEWIYEKLKLENGDHFGNGKKAKI